MGRCDWAQSGSWAALVEALGAVPVELTADPEAGAARDELDDTRALYEKNLATEIGRGRSHPVLALDPKSPEGPWDHSALSTAALRREAEALSRFPILSAKAIAQLQLAELLGKLRTALEPCTWEALPAAWGPLTALLEGITNAADREQEEVAAMCEEVDGRFRAYSASCLKLVRWWKARKWRQGVAVGAAAALVPVSTTVHKDSCV